MRPAPLAHADSLTGARPAQRAPGRGDAGRRPRLAPLLLLAGALGSALPALSCRQAAAPPPPVARVNGVAISAAAFDAALDRSIARYRGQGAVLPAAIQTRLEEAVLDRLIEAELVRQRAAALGLSVAAADVDAGLAQHRAAYRSPEAFADYLARAHLTEAALRDDLAQSLLRDAVVARLAPPQPIGDAALQAAYDADPARFAVPETVQAQRIVVRVPSGATAAVRAARRRVAERIRRAAMRPGADFAALATRDSEGPEQARGGDMGAPFARGQMPPAFDDAVFALPAGAISPILETPLGLEIVRVAAHAPARQPSLAEVRDTLEQALLARAAHGRRREAMRLLEEGARVEILGPHHRDRAAAEPARPPAPGATAPSPAAPATSTLATDAAAAPLAPSATPPPAPSVPPPAAP